MGLQPAGGVTWLLSIPQCEALALGRGGLTPVGGFVVSAVDNLSCGADDSPELKPTACRYAATGR